jgi:hypothetical protein
MKLIKIARSNLILLAMLVLVRPAEAAPADVAPLLQTRWYQDGPFARFTPGNERVGCWSTAYAQILFFHRLKPTGQARYDCSSGQKIDIDLDQYHFDFARFPNRVAPEAPPAETEQVARYSFAVAATVQKDFGTSGYKRLLNSVDDLEKHFAVDAEIYVHLGDKLPVDPADLKRKLQSEKITNLVNRAQIIKLLETELAARRPVYFHFGNIKDFGHSTVIDGIRGGANPMVHINYGAVEAEKNKWYELFAPISQPDDTTLRAFVTVKPR